MIYKTRYPDLNIKRYAMIIPAIFLFINFCYAKPLLLSGNDHKIPVSENISIEGVVRDEEGTLIKDATVSIKGTRNSTTTNEKGAFKLSDIAIGSTLTISHSAYESYTVEVTGTNTLDVIILQKRSSASMEILPATNELFGRQETTLLNSNTTTIRLYCGSRPKIEAGKEPLLVVNGKVVKYSDVLDKIDPKNIISMEVLKDTQSRLLYGPAGANGVIKLETKKK